MSEIINHKQWTHNSSYTSYFNNTNDWAEQLAVLLKKRVSVYNLTQNKYLYYNTTQQNALNCFSDEMPLGKSSPDYFFRFLNKHDALLINETVAKTTKMLQEISVHQLRDYKIVLDVCLKHNQEKWCRVIHTAIVYHLNTNDCILLCFCTVLNEQSHYTPLLRQLIHMPSLKFCWKQKKSQGNYLQLTQREIEIAQLATCGYESNSISEKLFISRNTVCNHRQNILRKLNLQQMSTVGLYLREIGII